MSTQNGSTTCEKCGGKVNTITSWCTPCNAELFEKEFPTWTSGIAEVDEFLRNTQITAERCESVFVWVDPSEFTQLEKVEYSKNNMAYWKEGHLLGWDLKSNKKIQYGGQWVKLVTNYCGEKHLATKFLKSLEFSKNNPSERLVYGITRDPITNYYAVIEKVVDKCSSCHNEWMSPRWCRGCNSDGRIRKWDSNANKWERGDPMFVALKEIEKEDGGINEFLREAKAMTQCREVNLGSLDCYGITRHPETQSYLIVMRYVEHGNLRKYLSDFVTNPWKDRLDRLWSLSIDLRSIHRSNLVHRDLHAGNVLLGENKRSFIADLGLACDD
ncbi:6585_t:CDS:2, partial [Racocetra fulgida]